MSQRHAIDRAPMASGVIVSHTQRSGVLSGRPATLPYP